MPRPSAHIHDATCAGEAPSACVAWNTMAAELVIADQHRDEPRHQRGQREVGDQRAPGGNPRCRRAGTAHRRRASSSGSAAKNASVR